MIQKQNGKRALPFQQYVQKYKYLLYYSLPKIIKTWVKNQKSFHVFRNKF
ncbi:hypothetical protein GCM10026983_27320 [Gracilibacillus alcaliphilus]